MQKAPYLEHVLGDTWCIVTGFCRIPLYMPDRANAVMMDSGLIKVDRDGILDLLEQEKIHVTSLLTSHFHRDHIGNHKAIQEKHGCKIYMTPFAAIIAEERSNLQFTGYETYVFTRARGEYPYSRPDHLIPRGSTQLTASGYSFGVLWLPGHAVEQVGFVTPDGVAYLADTLLSAHLLQAIRLPYYTNLKLDLEAKEALRELRYSRYILAHNGICDDLDGLIDQNIATAHAKAAMVEDLADHWMTLEQLCAAVMAHAGVDMHELSKVVGSKRNIQVLVEYLLETDRLSARVRDGFVEYKAKK